jgi:cytochrome c oxidase subunit I+III
MPGVVLSSTFLLLDRLIGTHFYNYAEGGDVLLWQHLFWFFAHPEVYIIFLPALGMGAQIVETVSRRPTFGYTAIVLSLIGTGVLAFGLWVHHMFATGLPRLGNSFFTASSMSIAIPTGVNLFCWMATIATGRVRFSVPFLWILSFFILFVVGGLSGIFLASVPIDLQVTDTYVIVAHIHFVLLGGAVAPLLGAAFYWFPKLTGRMLSETLGRWQVAFYTIGVGVSFGAMFVLGLRGMTRRVYTYPAAMDWHVLNFVASVAGWLVGVSFLLFAINVFRALSRKADAPDNPWEAPSLEWAAASPPDPYSFDYIRQVGSRSPLWAGQEEMAVTGLRADRKEVLATTVVDAQPDLREPVPKPSLWPFAAAVVTSIIFVGSIYTPDAVSYGAIPFAAVMTGWLLPRKSDYAPPLVTSGAGTS